MPVLESPRWDQWPLPHLGSQQFGHCFLFRLDPAASVAALEDEEAEHAASHVPRDWFLGTTVTVGVAPLYDVDRHAFLHFIICLVGTGLPEFEPASVPIAPSKQRAADRPPVNFEPALPWNDLYVHTYHHLTAARVSRLHYTPNEPVATMSPDAFDKLYEIRILDDLDRHRRLAEQELAEIEAEENEAERLELERNAMAADDERGSEPSMIESNSGSRISEYGDIQYLLAGVIQKRFERARICVEVWLDPATRPEPPTDPAKLKGAVAQIQQTWKDWQERMLKETLAKRPETTRNEWLQGVEEGEPADPEDLPQDAGIMLDDDDTILPEDAVDSRIEKESELDQVPGATGPDIFDHPTPLDAPFQVPGPAPVEEPSQQAKTLPPTTSLATPAPRDKDPGRATTTSPGSVQCKGQPAQPKVDTSSAHKQPAAPPQSSACTLRTIFKRFTASVLRDLRKSIYP